MRFYDDPADICTIVFSTGDDDGNDHYDLIERCLVSVIAGTDPRRYRLHIGCQNPSRRVLRLVQTLSRRSNISYLMGHPVPDRRGRLMFPKYPLMRRLYRRTQSRWLVWLDDDSFVTDRTWLDALETAIATNPLVAQFGKLADAGMMDPAPGWIEQATWYNPEFVHEHIRLADGSTRILCPYIVGGFYSLRRDAMIRCNIPDPRLIHNNGDWTTGLALQHQGFQLRHHVAGVAVNSHSRRGIHNDLWHPPGAAAELQRQAILHDQKQFVGSRPSPKLGL